MYTKNTIGSLFQYEMKQRNSSRTPNNNSLRPLLHRTIRLHSEHRDSGYQDPEFSLLLTGQAGGVKAIFSGQPHNYLQRRFMFEF